MLSIYERIIWRAKCQYYKRNSISNDYRPSGAENVAGAGVDKIGMPGPGSTLIFNFLINISI